MLVSIVTVTLNPGEMLEATIDSVMAQSSSDWEIIIQDGGSTDGTIDRIEEVSRIRVIRDRDQGIYDAMNRALDSVKGDYVIFLNAGDCLAHSDMISEVVSISDQEGPPELIFCDYKNMTSGRVTCLPDRLDTISLFRASYCHQAIFFSRGLFQSLGGYDTSFRIRADLEFLYRCHAGKPSIKVSRIPLCGVHYEGSGYSARGETQKLKKEELKNIRLKYLPKWKFLVFSLLHELTLVRLRTWWFRRAVQAP